MTDEKRRAYNQARYKQQKKASDALKLFRKMCPERYVELLAQVKAETHTKVATTIVSATTSTNRNACTDASIPDILKYRNTPNGPIRRNWPLSEEELDSIVYSPNERHIHIRAKDAWGVEHTYFESVPYPTNTLEQRVAVCLEMRNVVDPSATFELCYCRACTARHPSN